MNRERLANGGAYRISTHIKRRPAVNVHHAARYSERIGLPLNRFVTINFSLTSCRADRTSHAFRKLLTQRFAPWLRRTAQNDNCIPPTYVWTLEAGGGQAAAHWLVHVPSALQAAFDGKLNDWLASLFGDPPEPRAIEVKGIHNLIGLRRYVLKGIDPVWADHLRVRQIDQGTIVGKRSGFSRNLGPIARERGGYKPRRGPFGWSKKEDVTK